MQLNVAGHLIVKYTI